MSLRRMRCTECGVATTNYSSTMLKADRDLRLCKECEGKQGEGIQQRERSQSGSVSPPRKPQFQDPQAMKPPVTALHQRTEAPVMKEHRTKSSDPLAFKKPKFNPMRFKGKVILITGGTSGLGRHAAEGFAFEGGNVMICGRRQSLGDQVVEECKAQHYAGTINYVHCDVREEQDIINFINETVRRFGRIDCCFNNAGFPVYKWIHQLTTEEIDDILTTNLRGVLLCMKYEILQMMKQSPQGGSIVNDASIAGYYGSSILCSYVATKHAIVGLTKSAARYSSVGIRVNSVCPGPTQGTGIIEDLDALFDMERIPEERYGMPEGITSMTMYLCSDEASYIVGQNIPVDGGATALMGIGKWKKGIPGDPQANK